jgi:hypothetical protein
MPRYFNTFSQAYRDSDTPLGYPYVEEGHEAQGAEGTTEVAAATADAILAEVGDDAEAAQAALDAELTRDTPRKGLTAKLSAIIEAAA